MKYRKTGIAMALSFWFTAVLQTLCELYPQDMMLLQGALPYLDIACILIIVICYWTQRSSYKTKGLSSHVIWRGAYISALAGVVIKLLAELLVALHTTAILLDMIAVVLLLTSLLLMLRTDSDQGEEAMASS